MRKLASAIALAGVLILPACGPAPEKGFEYLGKWSNVEVSQSEDPHASGYVLELWKNDGKPVGFLFEFVGPPFDPPIGRLENVTLDPDSGKISFSTKMTTGVTLSRDHPEGVPSKTLYVFSGVLNEMGVRGTIEKQDHLDNRVPERTEITLTRERESSHAEHKTYQEWEAFYAPILRARGPKW